MGVYQRGIWGTSGVGVGRETREKCGSLGVTAPADLTVHEDAGCGLELSFSKISQGPVLGELPDVHP